MPTSDEWLIADREHEKMMLNMKLSAEADARRHKRQVMEEWTRRVGYIVAGLTVAAVILGIVFFVTQSISESDERQDQLELACIESGGTWTTLGGSRVDKACYQIGVVEGADR